MPHVAKESDSRLAKFKQKKKVNNGLKLYLTLEKQTSNAGGDVGGNVCGSQKSRSIDEYDSYGVIRLGGDELPGKVIAETCSTEFLLRAVAEVEVDTNGVSCGNILTYEDPEFLKAIDEVEAMCVANAGKAVNNISLGKIKMINDNVFTPMRGGRKRWQPHRRYKPCTSKCVQGSRG